ncbi:hypothetical protein MTR67_008354 [Solanum verrucosum]|uniref:Uncharacterized protein n=1 Tax=Solanum verrucosum TaxID=315347 RepID=A0AAF0Q1A4_SOLVR|nr:hypothetical protein MTR67_008354 [Solanum verrucosum]
MKNEGEKSEFTWGKDGASRQPACPKMFSETQVTRISIQRLVNPVEHSESLSKALGLGREEKKKRMKRRKRRAIKEIIMDIVGVIGAETIEVEGWRAWQSALQAPLKLRAGAWQSALQAPLKLRAGAWQSAQQAPLKFEG